MEGNITAGGHIRGTRVRRHQSPRLKVKAHASGKEPSGVNRGTLLTFFLKACWHEINAGIGACVGWTAPPLGAFFSRAWGVSWPPHSLCLLARGVVVSLSPSLGIGGYQTPSHGLSLVGLDCVCAGPWNRSGAPVLAETQTH